MEIYYYIAKNGKAPFVEWLESLKDHIARAEIKVRIDRLIRGLFGDTKSVGDGVEELRVNYGPGYRVYYGRVGKTIILLLCGGTKQQQQKDIDKAKMYFSEYWEVIHEKGEKKSER